MPTSRYTFEGFSCLFIGEGVDYVIMRHSVGVEFLIFQHSFVKEAIIYNNSQLN